MAKKLDLETPETVTPASYKYLCPACTNEAEYANEPRNLGSMVYCNHCGLSKPYDPQRWVKIEQ